MKKLALALTLFALPALADEPAGMDMSKMGPWTRKPTDEAKIKKEVLAFFAENEALSQKGDFEGALARIDFPVFMLTDDAAGVAQGGPWPKEMYVKEMKPFWDNMPKDLKTAHKPTIAVLSDSIVNVVDDFTITMGKTKLTGRNFAVLIKKDGKWMWKAMGEAGWGGPSEPKKP